MKHSKKLVPLLVKAPAPRKIYILDRQRHIILTEFDYNGKLSEVELSNLIALCIHWKRGIDELMFMEEVRDTELQLKMVGITQAVEKARRLYLNIKLTRREKEVLQGVLQSLSNKQIAQQVNLSERTVKFHVSSLLLKYRVKGRMELYRVACRADYAS